MELTRLFPDVGDAVNIRKLGSCPRIIATFVVKVITYHLVKQLGEQLHVILDVILGYRLMGNLPCVGKFDEY